jgi:hypothetical protein
MSISPGRFPLQVTLYTRVQDGSYSVTWDGSPIGSLNGHQPISRTDILL